MPRTTRSVIAAAEAILRPRAVVVPAAPKPRWSEPYPQTGGVKVQLLEAHGISDGTKIVQHPKGEVLTIDATVAHSLHRSIKGVL